MQRDLALLHGTFGIDARTTNLEPSELFNYINDMWIYLFAMGKYKIKDSEDGGYELIKVTL